MKMVPAHTIFLKSIPKTSCGVRPEYQCLVTIKKEGGTPKQQHGLTSSPMCLPCHSSESIMLSTHCKLNIYGPTYYLPLLKNSYVTLYHHPLVDVSVTFIKV